MTQTEDLASTAPEESRRYALTAGTELLGEYRDSAYQEPKYLIQRVDGQTMQLPSLLYRVACALDGSDAAHVADQVNTASGQDLTEEQIRFLVEERLYPAGIVSIEGAVPDDGVATPEPAAVPMPVRSDLLLALRYRAGVIPARAAARLAGLLQPLFARPVWIALVAAFLAVDVAIIAGGDLLGQSARGVEAVVAHPALLLAILGVTAGSGAIHEFGHITACRYGGARPGDVGVGLYIVWPALYSDVTDSYRLDRVGRLRTDLGGVYFDAIVMAALGLVYLRTGESWLFLALVGMHVETAWQFLPSIRLDGYYILADLVGVPDLFGYVKPALRSVLPGRPVDPRVAELKPRARRIVVLWVLVVIPTLAGWIVLFVVAAPHVLPVAWQSLLAYLHNLDIAVRNGDLVTTTLGVVQMFLLALPWIGTALILRMLIDIPVKKWRARRGGPALSDAARVSVRRWSSLALLLALGCLLVARVGAVAASRPATDDETRLADGALAALHRSAAPSGSVGERLTQLQLAVYGWITGAFDRHASSVAGAREVALLATTVLVTCIVALVLAHRLRPLAVAVPLAAALAMGPVVAELATIGPAVLGVAWTSLGVLLLTQVRHSLSVVLGAASVLVGLATEPLLALPLAICAAVGLLRGEGRWTRPTWWPAPEEEVVPSTGEPHPTAPHPGPRHGAPEADLWWSPARWAGVGGLALTGVLGVVLAGGGETSTPDPAARTVLLLVAAVVVIGAGAGRRLRSPALGTAAVLVLAALPWPGAGSAALLTLVASSLLAALLIDGVVRAPVAERPHPLLRGVVVVPACLLVVVGLLFQPARAPAGQDTVVGSGIAGTGSVGSTVPVPPQGVG